MSRFVVAFVAVGLTLGASEIARAEEVDDIYEVPAAMAFQGPKDQVTRGVTLYLNKGGGTVVAGWDDSAENTSSIVFNVGESQQIPAWRGGDRKWKKVVACVRDRFADFDVEVVTERPSTGDYVMIMVGGRPSLFGYGDGVSGVAPYTGEVLHAAIGYVFSDNLRNDVDGTCLAVVHETGHTLGLDHAYLCEDPMSYLWGCGPKRFRDQDASCGENEPRYCGDGEETQNSWRRLAAAVGLRGERPEPEEDEEEDVEEDPDEEPWNQPADLDADVEAPAVAIDATEEWLPGNQWIEIVVRAADDSGIADVELGWASESTELVIACSQPPEDMPVQCVRDGDTFRFQLNVGLGWRAMIARATDRDGNQGLSEARVLYLAE
jgi:hypothetical protein